MEVSTRDLLQELAAKPIGSPELFEEACRKGLTREKVSAELAETVLRTSKKWLPAGKRAPTTPESRARQKELASLQIDLEDAVEAAGGQRGRC